jgi:hypothetical protein
MSTTTTEPAAPAAPLLGGDPPASATAPAAPAAGEGAPAAADPRAWLPEEFRADPLFKDIADPAALAKSYGHAARMVGMDKGQVLRLPAEGDEAARAELFNRLGRPETPDKYEFPELPAPLVDGVEPAARETFHKLGLSAAQARGVMELYGGQVQAAEAARLARASELEAAVERDLRAEYGEAFDDKLHAANRAIAEFGGKELGKLLTEARMPDGTRMGNHPLLVKAFAAAGARLAEPADLRGGSSGGSAQGALTPAEAQAELAALKGDREFFAARTNPRHADHAKAVARWDRINRALAGGAGMMVE